MSFLTVRYSDVDSEELFFQFLENLSLPNIPVKDEKNLSSDLNEVIRTI